MSEPDLFSEAAKPENETAGHARSNSNDLVGLETRVARSALWAAYGDALGWISELTDATGLKRRTGGCATGQANRVEASDWRPLRCTSNAAPRLLFR